MLQTPRDFGFHQKPMPTVRFIGKPGLNLFHRDFPVQFRIQRDRNLSQSSAGMGSQHAETPARLMGQLRTACGGCARVGMRDRCTIQRCIDIVVLEGVQIVLQRGQRTQGGQALLRVAAVHLQMFRHHGHQKLVGVLTQRTLRQQDIFESGLLVEQPLLHRRDQLVTMDKVHLQRKNADQQIPIVLWICHDGLEPSFRGALAK